MSAKKQKNGISFAEVPGVEFETVAIKKELSAGGKAALELDQMNE